tara:strand:- start:415 stop:609 length:195 start_codon:yes stop_codon:yes gene_type:complete
LGPGFVGAVILFSTLFTGIVRSSVICDLPVQLRSFRGSEKYCSGALISKMVFLFFYGMLRIMTI